MRRWIFVTTAVLAALTGVVAVLSYFIGIHQGRAVTRLTHGQDSPTLRVGFSDAIVRIAFFEFDQTLNVSLPGSQQPFLTTGWFDARLFGWSSALWPGNLAGAFRLRTFWFSLWPVVGLLALPGLYDFGYRPWRARRRLARGCCPQCAYDLRGGTGQCPECGWTPKPSCLETRIGDGVFGRRESQRKKEASS